MSVWAAFPFPVSTNKKEFLQAPPLGDLQDMKGNLAGRAYVLEKM
jgi:hypothetical protein